MKENICKYIIKSQRKYAQKQGGFNLTPENYKYRTDPLFLRNSFDTTNDLSMPNISKADLVLSSESDLRLIGFDRVKNGKDNHYNRMVHFFLYDYKFEDIWNNPQKYVDKLKKIQSCIYAGFQYVY